MFLLVAWPVALVFKNTFADGFGACCDTSLATRRSPRDLADARRSRVWAVVINLVFGVAISILLVRYDFPGKRALLSALIDLPLAVSPVVVGLALVLVYNGRDGWFGPSLEDARLPDHLRHPRHGHGDRVRVAAAGDPRGRAGARGDRRPTRSRPPGASAPTRCRRSGGSPCPRIKWAVVYGVVLSLARSLGEFGAVKIVSGNVVGQTQTATLSVEQTYQNFQQDSASYGIAALSLAFAVDGLPSSSWRSSAGRQEQQE